MGCHTSTLLCQMVTSAIYNVQRTTFIAPLQNQHHVHVCSATQYLNQHPLRLPSSQSLKRRKKFSLVFSCKLQYVRQCFCAVSHCLKFLETSQLLILGNIFTKFSVWQVIVCKLYCVLCLIASSARNMDMHMRLMLAVLQISKWN